MSRSGYSDDYGLGDNSVYLYRGAVNSAIRGKRGQAFLRELATALDEMPVKALIAEDLESEGQFCAIGTVGARRGIDMKGLDPEDADRVGKTFDIAESMAREIVYINDEGSYVNAGETPAQRWTRMRAWVNDQITESL